MTPKQHIILGYPNSGKTTFLAAFWHILDAGEATSLVLEKTSGDMRYLNEIKNIWLRCEQVPRTLTSSEDMVEILVRESETDNSMALQLPDFSGETFQAMFADRQCDKRFLEILNQSDGILFFINADRTNDTMAVADHDFPEDGGAAETDADATGFEGLTDFDPRLVAEQTRIIDTLQILHVSPFQTVHRRLVIAISAWDVVSSDGCSPEEWVARDMPMLSQYLANNDDVYEVRFCGMSAQGGNFDSETRDKLLAMNPADRVQCVWGGQFSSDITQPLMWLSEDNV
jgi:hypothetical protein